MPKGHVIPLPLLCTVNFGAPVPLQAGDAMDAKTLYLQRCRDELQALKPVRDSATKSSVLLDLGADGVTGLERIPTPVLHQVRTLTGTMPELLSPAFDDATGAWVRVILQGERPPGALATLKERFPSLLAFQHEAPTRTADHYALLAAFYLILPLQYYFISVGWYGLFSVFIPVYGFLLLPILATLGNDTQQFLTRASSVQWGLMIAVYCISCIPALMVLDIPGYQNNNLLLINWLILVVQSSDVLQYVCGKLFGKHKIAPVLSPSKTVEGFVGGVLLASLLGAALFWITPFAWWQAALIAILVNLMGFAGGLVMSAIKRDRGVKDWGAMIEGHGGMLDRLDSLCFSAPIFFHVVRYFWV